MHFDEPHQTGQQVVEQGAQYLDLLKNTIDIRTIPFSDRGSRLLVYLSPDGGSLCVRLAERLINLQPDIEAYLKRPPFISELRLFGEGDAALALEPEVHPHVLNFPNGAKRVGLVFLSPNTIAVGIPPGSRLGLTFHVSPLFWTETPDGGAFKGIKDLHYATNGEVERNEIVPDRGGYRVTFVVTGGEDDMIIISIGSNGESHEPPVPFSHAFEASRNRWMSWFDRVPEVSEKYRSIYALAWWIMANNLISPKGMVTHEAMMPSKSSYVGLWLWDNAMHSIAYRHVDIVLARNQIRAILANQLPDGMLPDAIFDEGVVSSIDHPIYAEVTKPPVLAWAAVKLHETTPDREFLQEIYVPLVRWNAWWFSMNDDDVDGLVQYNHPYSSGMDDNPTWDYGMPVESPDLNTYLCVQMQSLAIIAEELGMSNDAAMWRRRSKAIVRRMIEDLWDDEAGLFRPTCDGNPIPVVTPICLLPLWTGELPAEINERLIAHLTDPEEFWGDFVIPSVARNDPHFEPGVMWRGPVWVNLNYFFIEALKRLGRDDVAATLLEKSLDLVTNNKSISEYYNATSGQSQPTAADAFGWTAALFIDLALQGGPHG